MGFSPVALATFDSLDLQAPGTPLLSASQTNNSSAKFTLTPSTTDSDGSPLTGLTFGEVCVIQADNATASGFLSDFDGAKASPGAQNFQIPNLSAGVPVDGNAVLNVVGVPWSFLARVADHPLPV